ncbi:hypothetical protein JCM21738_2399 [Mesobacillus boroniphilus JCM 21738]|uniref:Uncharacterized protein n=1 Tax=Mesobacillus boroniphilus JCM 21738 TaxID=1294265 RepID=W4RPP8_9BACI|nr:hypothetical protein JCM21738_2399 [Mesobacillus boroniphilus JCM 21738]
MVEFIKDLILHFSIILSLSFMYNFLWMQKRSVYKKQVFKMAILAALMMTMAFPVRFDGGLEFDLKLIPVFIAFFYLSRLIAFCLWLSCCYCRASWGLTSSRSRPSIIWSY